MNRNQSGQKIPVYAYIPSTGLPRTGDAGNITATLSKDGAVAAAIADTNPTEGAGGWYWFDLTQAETDCRVATVAGASATGDTAIVPVVFSTGSDANVTQLLGGAIPAPTVTGIPRVDQTHALGAPVTNAYYAHIEVSEEGADDDHQITATWFKNGVPSPAITLPTIKVVSLAATPANVLPASAGTQAMTVQGTNVARYLDTGPAMTKGVQYAVTVAATIDAAARTLTGTIMLPDAGSGASAASIASEVRTELTTELGHIDADISSRATAAAVTTIDSNVDAILVDTGTTLPTSLTTIENKVDVVDGIVDRISDDIDALNNPTAASIADAVWDEAQAVHTTAGTFGSFLDASVSGVSTGGVSAADIADAVWDEALSGHTTAGTAGKSIADTETDAAAILVDTGTTIPGTIATVDANVDAILLDTAEIGAAGAGLTDLATASALATVDSNVDAILVDTGTTLPSSLTTIEGKVDTVDGVVDSIVIDIAALNDVAAADVATAILDAANGIETGVTPRQALRGILSALASKVSGMESNAPVFRDVGDTKNRITAATDSNGNRTSVTLDLT